MVTDFPPSPSATNGAASAQPSGTGLSGPGPVRTPGQEMTRSLSDETGSNGQSDPSGLLRAGYTSSTATVADDESHTAPRGNDGLVQSPGILAPPLSLASRTQTAPVPLSTPMAPPTPGVSTPGFHQSPDLHGVALSGRGQGYMHSASVTPNAQPLARHHTVPATLSPQVNSPRMTGTSSEGIYTATYSGVAVFEMMVNGVAVMRRRHDSSLNATQILKVAGVEKSKRTKVLEKEILTGVHEKVQGGYGKYQGTWIPYDRAISLCKQYSVYDLLEPLLKFDMHNSGMENTPTKEQAMAAKRKRSVAGHQVSMHTPYIDNYSAPYHAFSRPLQITGTAGSQPTPLSISASAALSSLGGGNVVGDYDSSERDIKRGRYEPSIGGSSSVAAAAAAAAAVALGSPSLGSTDRQLNSLPTAPQPQSPAIDDENIPDTDQPLEPIRANDSNYESRELVTQIFMDPSVVDLGSIVAQHETNGKEVNFDVSIDESGHSALHWAAALARIPLVRELIKHGADCRRGNIAGETPLVRAVMVTNNSDYSQFGELLDLLYPAIPLVDCKGRTILHHIAVTAAIKGRSDASKYYLETLLEWIVKRGSKGKTGRFGMRRFMTEIVNRRDENGDTALNIAARVGHKSIVQQLLDVGAVATVPNRAGLRPIDFKIGMIVASSSGGQDSRQISAVGENGESSGASAAATSAAALANSGVDTFLAKSRDRRKKIVGGMVEAVESLDKEFDQELEVKQQLINKMSARLRESNILLTSQRGHMTRLKEWSSQLSEWQRSSQNLERAVEEEDRKFKDEEKRHGREVPLGFEGNFDADQPFRLWGDSEELSQMPPQLLKARIKAYRMNERTLRSLADSLRGRSVELEEKFRKVVSRCTRVEESQVDNLLPGLVQAIESDPPEVDMTRVTGLLRKIDDSMIA